MITFKQFTDATGLAPEQDDLERVNCERQGHMYHHNCGWCYLSNLPVFMCAGKHDGPHQLMKPEQL